MAPNITSSNNEMPKAWYKGHYFPTKQEGSKFYIEVNGVKEEVDKNDLFGMNSWEKLDESFEEQIENHEKWKNHWQELQNKASVMYENAIATFKKSSKKYNEITQGRSLNELEGTKKEEAKQYYSDMRSAKSTQIRSVSDSIFYGRMAVDETFYMQDISNLQGIANHMAQG